MELKLSNSFQISDDIGGVDPVERSGNRWKKEDLSRHRKGRPAESKNGLAFASRGKDDIGMDNSAMKRTPLFAAHQKLGGKLVEFGGWEMPVHYTSILDEHQTVRTAAGLFDISHMGEVQVSGPAAESSLNQILTNDVRKLDIGQGQYTLMCN